MSTSADRLDNDSHQTSAKGSNLSFFLGVCSILWLYLGLPYLGEGAGSVIWIIFCIGAVSLGYRARKQIELNPKLGGSEMANAGILGGMIGLFMVIVYLGTVLTT